MKKLALHGLTIIENDGPIEELLSVMNQAAILKSKTSEKVMTGEVQAVVDLFADVSRHVKVCGAGGGGFVYVNHEEDVSLETIKSFGVEATEFNLSPIGSVTIYEN